MAEDIDPNTNLNKIPYKILLTLHKYLDTLDSQRNWRSLIAAIPDNPYTNSADVENFSLELMRGGSPTASLLRDLGNRGYTVRQLISYLESMKHENALKLIKKEEPVHITKQPKSASLMEKQTLRLTCEATGFPYPKYQWFRTILEEVNGMIDRKCQIIQTGTDKVLEVQNVDDDDSGLYICRIHNRISYQFTKWVQVDVIVKNEPLKIAVQPESKIVEEGKAIKLVCAAIAKPAPIYQWFRYDQYIERETSSELYWEKALPEDNAVYRCKVSNMNEEVWSDAVQVTIIPKGPPVILKQPRDTECQIGKPVVLQCEARGKQPLSYQWYKNGDIPIHGAIQETLQISQTQVEDQGQYYCKVKNSYGFTVSKIATVLLRNQIPQHYATDKIALVIGNQEFRSEGPLQAPAKDAYALASLLSIDCGFKVVSLIDLTLEEMERAVNAFCELLGPGVYGLFYFAGHGFEHNGQSYLVPVDAPAGYAVEDCLCAQWVLDKMQRRQTGLNVLLLDTCRIVNSYVRGTITPYEPKVRGNTVFGYASSFTTGAFEVTGAENGIFMKYLKRHITTKDKVTRIIERVISDVARDPDAKERQYPELKSDLREYRTLLDPIAHDGHTQEFLIRRQQWQNAHQLPPPVSLSFQLEGFKIVVKISFSTPFSNQLIIFVNVENPGPTSRCTATLQDFPPELDVNVRYTVMNQTYENAMQDPRYRSLPHPVRDNALITYVKNIQKLRDDMTISIVLDMECNGRKLTARSPYVIEKPLIARCAMFQRKPVEDGY